MESVLGYKQKISFVSTFCLGRRLYVIDHATISVDHVDHEIIYPLQTGQRLRSKSMGVGWGNFMNMELRLGHVESVGKGHLSSFVNLYVEFQQG